MEGPPEEEYVTFMKNAGIRHVEIHILPNKGGVCVNPGVIIKALDVVADAENYPLLIHCNKGKHRTGCVVGTLRKCQGWPLQAIVSEYHDYAGVKARLWDEVFLEYFDETLSEVKIDEDTYSLLREYLA